MHHLLNCHGEWAAVIAALTSFGTIKIYYQSWRNKNDQNQN